MDLHTVTGFRRARERADLALAPGERILAGGTWLFSEPQPGVTGLVDLTTMGWEPLEPLPDGGLSVAATCPIADLAGYGERTGPRCSPSARTPCWRRGRSGTPRPSAGTCAVPTPPPGWSRSPRRSTASPSSGPPTATSTGSRSRRSSPGTAPPRCAPARSCARSSCPVPHCAPAPPSARSHSPSSAAPAPCSPGGSTPRADGGAATFVITAATEAPTVLRYPAGVPDADRLRADVDAVDGWYTDPLGSADWRHGVSAVLLEQIREELS
nr:FAD-binding molybdopterin dehydrogenase [Pseudonocardia sp. ICBG601]